MTDSAHFSSKTDMWETPQDLFDQINAEYQFTTDVCATAVNAKCDHYYTPEMDGLKQLWTGRCWMNPPYGRQIGKWVQKASMADCLVVCLLPARTDTRWWQDYCTKGRIEFLRGRLKFGDSKHNAPFPNAIVVFDVISRLRIAA